MHRSPSHFHWPHQSSRCGRPALQSMSRRLAGSATTIRGPDAFQFVSIAITPERCHVPRSRKSPRCPALDREPIFAERSPSQKDADGCCAGNSTAHFSEEPDRATRRATDVTVGTAPSAGLSSSWCSMRPLGRMTARPDERPTSSPVRGLTPTDESELPQIPFGNPLPDGCRCRRDDNRPLTSDSPSSG